MNAAALNQKDQRRAENAARRQRSADLGNPWYADHGGGRGRRHEPHAVLTIEEGFVCETEDAATANLIVELLGALQQAKAALQPNTAVNGPAYRAWLRASRALERTEKQRGRARAV